MRTILVIDNKISDAGKLASCINDKLSGQLKCSVAREIMEVITSDWSVKKSYLADVAFIHINNSFADTFLKECCNEFQEMFITSTVPQDQQLQGIECEKAQLFRTPVTDDGSWKVLPWEILKDNWREGERFPIDQFLIRSTNGLLKFIPAIAILCQGFLTVYVYKFDEYANEKTRVALERMGWTEFLQGGGSRLIESVDLSSKWDGAEGVSNSKWWTDALGESQESVQEALVNEMGGNIPDCIQELINSIYNNTDIKPGEVADTFIAVTDRLEKIHDEEPDD